MLKGRKGGLPKKAGRLRYSAYDMHKFALARYASRLTSPLASPLTSSLASPHASSRAW